MIETTKITIENIDGEKLELTIEEAKALQKELNDMFGVEKEKIYIPSVPVNPYPWDTDPYRQPSPWVNPYPNPFEPYITYTTGTSYKISDVQNSPDGSSTLTLTELSPEDLKNDIIQIYWNR